MLKSSEKLDKARDMVGFMDCKFLTLNAKQ